MMSNRRIEMKMNIAKVVKFRLFIFGLLCIIGTPMYTNAISLGGVKINESLSEEIWMEIEHDYIRLDAMPTDIKFRDECHGWALSQNRKGLGNGIILFSNDTGLSWNLQYFNDTMWLKNIEFNEGLVWVAGEGGLLYTNNDGASWNYKPVGTEHDNFRSIHFYNDTLGWAGSNRGVYKTNDGGTTWNMVFRWTFGDSPRSIHFTSSLIGWAIGSYGIYHTSDGGISWEVYHTKGGWDFSFLSDTEAWAVGDGMLAHMVDGMNWIEQSLPANEYYRLPYMTDIQFLNATHGWIGASDPMIAHTQNGGIDWYEQIVSYDTRIMSLNLINATHGCAIGWGGHIFRTTRANELGEYSWSTINVALVYGVTLVLIAVVAISIMFLRFRNKPPVVSPAPDIE